MENDEQQKLEHEELSVGDIAVTVSLGIVASLGKYLNNTQYVPRHPSTQQSSYSREQIERFAAKNVRFDKDIPVEDRIRLTAHYQEVLEKLPTWQQVLAIESGTPIRFTSGISNSNESVETVGRYHARSGKLFVYAEAADVDKTIRHEMGHEADGKSGPLFGWWSEEKTDWRLALREEIKRWDAQGEKTSFFDKLKAFLSDDNQIKKHLSKGYKAKEWPLEAIAEVTVMQNQLYEKYIGDEKKVDAEMNRLQPHLWPVYRDHYIPHLQNIAAKLNPYIDLEARPVGVIHAAAPEMVPQPHQQQQAQVHVGAARNGEKPWTHEDWARLAREMAPPPVKRLGPIIDKGLPYLPGEPADPRVAQHLVKPVPPKVNMGYHAGMLAGHSIGMATVGLNAAAAAKAHREGRDDEARHYAAVALQATGMEMAFSETGVRTGLKTAELASEAVGLKAFTLAVKGVGTKMPVVGAVVGGVFMIAETGHEIYKASKGESNREKVISTLGSGAIDTLSGLFGFLGLGAGEAAHEGWRAGSAKMFGEKNAARHGAIIELAGMGAQLASSPPPPAPKPAGVPKPGLHKFELEVAQAAKLDKNHNGQFEGDEVAVAKALARKLNGMGITMQSADKDRNGDISAGELGHAIRDARAKSAQKSLS